LPRGLVSAKELTCRFIDLLNREPDSGCQLPVMDVPVLLHDRIEHLGDGIA